MMDDGKIERLLRLTDATQDVEIDCTTCLDLVPLYVEKEISGRDAAREIPELHQHLILCGDCREEYEALRDLVALEESSGLPDRETLLHDLDGA